MNTVTYAVTVVTEDALSPVDVLLGTVEATEANWDRRVRNAAADWTSRNDFTIRMDSPWHATVIFN